MSKRRALTISALVVAALSAAGCPKKGGGDGTDDTTADTRPPKKTILTWGISPAAARDGIPQKDVFLAVTDEMGKSVSYPLGTYAGDCIIVGAIETYQALTAVSCTHEQAGWQLHAASNPGKVVVLKMQIVRGVQPDPFAREPVLEVPVPVGAKLEVGLQDARNPAVPR
jgi:hypothetical protein